MKHTRVSPHLGWTPSMAGSQTWASSAPDSPLSPPQHFRQAAGGPGCTVCASWQIWLHRLCLVADPATPCVPHGYSLLSPLLFLIPWQLQGRLSWSCVGRPFPSALDGGLSTLDAFARIIFCRPEQGAERCRNRTGGCAAVGNTAVGNSRVTIAESLEQRC